MRHEAQNIIWCDSLHIYSKDCLFCLLMLECNGWISSPNWSISFFVWKNWLAKYNFKNTKFMSLNKFNIYLPLNIKRQTSLDKDLNYQYNLTNWYVSNKKTLHVFIFVQKTMSAKYRQNLHLYLRISTISFESSDANHSILLHIWNDSELLIINYFEYTT